MAVIGMALVPHGLFLPEGMHCILWAVSGFSPPKSVNMSHNSSVAWLEPKGKKLKGRRSNMTSKVQKNSY